MAKSFMHKARSYEAKRKTNPVLAARDVSVRKACKRVLRDFRRLYADALALWKAGDRMVVFPLGTWWMRVHHRAEVLSTP